MAYSTSDIRNVCLVGPSNAGKTLLAESLLHAGGKIAAKGSIAKGNTVSDFTDREREIGHSQYCSVLHLDHGGIHVNLIDTPGYRDFYARALSVLPSAETSSRAGLEGSAPHKTQYSRFMVGSARERYSATSLIPE